MELEKYNPLPALVTKITHIEKPKFNVIDAHNHLAAPYGGAWDERPFSELIAVLDEAQVEGFVDLDGGWGEALLRKHLDLFKAKAPERFQIFGGVDWVAWQIYGDRFGEYAAERLRQQKIWGAQGLKIWKPFGLSVTDQHGVLARIDDPRLDPIWQAAGELGLPVIIHIADPVAFFTPVDEHNERWEELSAHPEAMFPSPPFPAFHTLIESFARMVKKHKNTTFIGAHVGCYAENLAWVSDLIRQAPNFYVDISARLGELGRQPYSSRKFLVEHQERVLFGTDNPASVEIYKTYYRFLESDDEYFAYGADPNGIPGQGRWNIYGVGLPETVLEKIYRGNAKKILHY